MYCKDLTQIKDVFRLQYERAKSLLLSCKNGIDVEVVEHKHKRTNEQNAYYWLFNNHVAEFLNGAGLGYGKHNIPYNKDLIHYINKRIFGVDTTTKMSIQEFCEYMTKLIIFWTEETNGHFEMPELPEEYLAKKGYTKEYMRA